MVSLDELRNESYKRYANYPVTLDDGTTLELRAGLRLTSDERTELTKKQETIQALQSGENGSNGSVAADDGDAIAVLRSILLLVADDTSKAEKLVDNIGDDLPLLVSVFEKYAEHTQPGEA